MESPSTVVKLGKFTSRLSVANAVALKPYTLIPYTLVIFKSYSAVDPFTRQYLTEKVNDTILISKILSVAVMVKTFGEQSGNSTP